jgi:hypothetical protein
MCSFFSLVSDGKGKIMFFDWKLRKQILAKKLDCQPDSHTSIADYHGYKGEKEDKLNKYEYNFLTGNFVIDQLNADNNDSADVKKFCKKLNPKKVVPALVVKPILNPFKDKSCVKITKADLRLLKKWASVRDSVGASVRDSVGASVWASVGDSVRASVRDSVGDSVRDSVRDSVGASVRDSVRDSVGASVWDSVRDSVWAYISSFFAIKYKYDFSFCVKLWEKGLFPSFDGKIWRLHGKDGKILKEITPEDLKKVK